jgi:hypothetical protein
MFRKKDDILLKSAFEKAFPDLLRFYFENADAIFDMEKGFEFLDKELIELFPELERQGGTRFVDMLVKTFLKDGTEEWILIHLEIQRGQHKGFCPQDVPILVLNLRSLWSGYCRPCSVYRK